MGIDSISLNKSMAASLINVTTSSRFTLALSETSNALTEDSQQSSSGADSGAQGNQLFMQSVFATLAKFGLELPKPSAGTSVSEAQPNIENNPEHAKQLALHDFVHQLLQTLTPTTPAGSTSTQGNDISLQFQYSTNVILQVENLQQQFTRTNAEISSDPSLRPLQASFSNLLDLLGPVKSNGESSTDQQHPTPIKLTDFLEQLTETLRSVPGLGSELPAASGNLVNTAA